MPGARTPPCAAGTCVTIPAPRAGTRSGFNVKKQLWTETRIRPAVAVGLVNIGSQASPNFWFTTTKHLGRLGLGIGWSDAGA